MPTLVGRRRCRRRSSSTSTSPTQASHVRAGPNESRVWTSPKGATKGFIKAEVISFDNLVEDGPVAEARSRGNTRMEGRDNVMMEFRFNV